MTPRHLDFGLLPLGGAATQVAQLHSAGNPTVRIGSMRIEGSGFTLRDAPSSLDLALGEQISLPIAFSPTTERSEGRLMVEAAEDGSSCSPAPELLLRHDGTAAAVVDAVTASSGLFEVDFEAEQHALAPGAELPLRVSLDAELAGSCKERSVSPAMHQPIRAPACAHSFGIIRAWSCRSRSTSAASPRAVTTAHRS